MKNKGYKAGFRFFHNYNLPRTIRGEKTQYFLLAMSLLAISLGIFLLPQLAFLSSISPEKIIELTNEKRAANGLEPLTANQLLGKAAYDKAEALLASQEFRHDLSGQKFSAWIKNAGYQYSYAGENLAVDFLTAEGVLAAWLDSPTHRKNLLNEHFQEIGVAVVEGKFQGRDSILVVQVFGAPLGPYLAGPDSPPAGRAAAPAPASYASWNDSQFAFAGQPQPAGESFYSQLMVNTKKLPLFWQNGKKLMVDILSFKIVVNLSAYAIGIYIALVLMVSSAYLYINRRHSGHWA